MAEAGHEEALGVGVEAGAAFAGGVEGADVDRVGEAQEGDWQERDQGLVDVDDVEVLLVEDAAHRPGESG